LLQTEDGILSGARKGKFCWQQRDRQQQQQQQQRRRQL
jgi:hypothetical protein